MDIAINLGILVVCLLALAAIFFTFMMIFRLLARVGGINVFSSERGNYTTIFRAFFVQDALKEDSGISTKSAIFRGLLAFIAMLALITTVTILVIIPAVKVSS